MVRAPDRATTDGAPQADSRPQLAGSVQQWADDLRTLAERADQLAAGMDFRFLYNRNRHLFSVGYNVALGRLDWQAQEDGF